MYKYITLRKSLTNIQGHTIGIYKIDGEYYPVVYEDEVHFKVLEIGNLLGLHEITFNKSERSFQRFEGGKTLAQMLQNPMEYNKFCESLT